MWHWCRKGCGGYVEDKKEHDNCEKEQRFPESNKNTVWPSKGRRKNFNDSKYLVGSAGKK